MGMSFMMVENGVVVLKSKRDELKEAFCIAYNEWVSSIDMFIPHREKDVIWDRYCTARDAWHRLAGGHVQDIN